MYDNEYFMAHNMIACKRTAVTLSKPHDGCRLTDDTQCPILLFYCPPRAEAAALPSLRNRDPR